MVGAENRARAGKSLMVKIPSWPGEESCSFLWIAWAKWKIHAARVEFGKVTSDWWVARESAAVITIWGGLNQFGRRYAWVDSVPVFVNMRVQEAFRINPDALKTFSANFNFLLFLRFLVSLLFVRWKSAQHFPLPITCVPQTLLQQTYG